LLHLSLAAFKADFFSGATFSLIPNTTVPFKQYSQLPSVPGPLAPKINSKNVLFIIKI
jgi:hypothetical protein